MIGKPPIKLSKEERQALFTALSLAGPRYDLAGHQTNPTTKFVICHGFFSKPEINIAAMLYRNDVIVQRSVFQ